MLSNVLFVGWHLWATDRLQALASVLVFAAVVALMLFFEGLRFGLIDDLRQFPAALPADLVAIERDVGQFAMTASKLPQLSRSQAESLGGVLTAEPLALAPIILTWADRKTPSMILGYDRAVFPRELAQGRRIQGPREVVIDTALAIRHRLAPGDTVEIFDTPLTVVGISRGTTSPFTPYLFLTYDDLIDIFLEADLSIGSDDFSFVSALLINLEPGRPIPALRADLEATMPDADFFTPAELGERDARYGAKLLGPVLILTSGIAWIIGFLVMGFLRYSAVDARLREYAVQKALGADQRFLGGVLSIGGLLLVVLAFPLGLIGSMGLAHALHAWNPLFSAMPLEPRVLTGGLVATVVAGITGSLLPLHRLLRLDPTLVFQR